MRGHLAASAAILLLVTASAHPGDGDWIPLFNGKDLDGWVVKATPQDRDKVFWSVEDGAISCNSMARSDHNYVWLMTEGEFGDFELELRVQGFSDSPGNSGVQVRSRFDEGPDAPNGGWLDGPQVDVHPPTPWRTGLIYDETRGHQRWISPSLTDWRIDESFAVPGARFHHAEEGWNDIHILCKGTRIKTTVNGVVISDYDGAGVLDDEHHQLRRVGLKGHIALQLHANDELRIRFKDIRLRQLR